MSMKPQEISPVPEETARVARAANPKGNVYMHLRDELGSIYQDQMFTALFPRRRQPAEAPWRLALVTVMQYMEGLSDRQATEAMRERIDWKYTLGLELTDPGFDFSVLQNFVHAYSPEALKHTSCRRCSSCVSVVAGCRRADGRQ
jgi:transposase